jgi:hypothetical protein
VYFENVSLGCMPFVRKRIGDRDYFDMAKTSPRFLPVSDIGLKLILANLDRHILLDNSGSPLSSLCLVRTGAVVDETDSLSAAIRAESVPELNAALSIVKAVLPMDCTLGLVGYGALEMLLGGDLDIVVSALSLDRLHAARAAIAGLAGRGESSYLEYLWPLSRRLANASLDCFYVLTGGHPIYAELEHARILNPCFEFDQVVSEHDEGILGTPMWELESGLILVSIDNGLRGRFRRGDRLVGRGIHSVVAGREVVVVQSSETLTVIR